MLIKKKEKLSRYYNVISVKLRKKKTIIYYFQKSDVRLTKKIVAKNMDKT